MLATSRWANLPVSVANHATREEEASACERIASGAWLPVSAMWGGFPIGGIVEMLRAEFQRFSEDSQATDYDLAMRDGWLYAARMIVSRFGGGES